MKRVPATSGGRRGRLNHVVEREGVIFGNNPFHSGSGLRMSYWKAAGGGGGEGPGVGGVCGVDGGSAFICGGVRDGGGCFVVGSSGFSSGGAS